MASVYVDCNNCSADIVPGDYTPQTILVTVTCASDYEFESVPTVEYTKVSTTGRYTRNTYNFDKVNDTTYTHNLVISAPGDGVRSWSYTITASAIKKTAILDKYAFITVYRPTLDEMRLLVKARWKQWDIEGSTVGDRTNPYIDTAQYITSLHKVYFQLVPDSRDRVYFGPYDMGVESDIIGNDIVTLDFGSVTIHGTHQNAIDYEHTEMQAYLPFAGFVTLSPLDFMDKQISLLYQIDIISGDGLAIFKTGDNVIMSVSCNVSFKIPYQMTNGVQIANNIQTNTNYLLNSPPFIYVKSHAALDPDTALPYHDTKFYACFGDLTGYTEAQEIDFKVVSPHITKTEIDEIKRLIESGVFL